MNEQTCPIMLCFNDNYVLPAGVAIWSLLHHANRSYTYPIYVVHSDITEAHQERLRKTVAKFPNASIAFMKADAVLDDLWAVTKGKFSFSKEIYCKFFIGELFPQYRRMLITDVDVIFMDDIAPLFEMVPEGDFAYAGIQDLKHPAESPLGRWCATHQIPIQMEQWRQNPNLSIGAGLLMANLDYLREHKLAAEMVKCTLECCERLILPEQNVINLVCGNVNVRLPLRAMMCSYYYPYARKWKGWCASHEAHGYSEQEVREALAHPIQLHYAAGNLKPWNNLNVPKAWVWVRYCLRSGWFGDFAVRYLRLAPALTRGFIMRCWRFGLRKMRMAK